MRVFIGEKLLVCVLDDQDHVGVYVSRCECMRNVFCIGVFGVAPHANIHTTLIWQSLICLANSTERRREGGRGRGRKREGGEERDKSCQKQIKTNRESTEIKHQTLIPYRDLNLSVKMNLFQFLP